LTGFRGFKAELHGDITGSVFQFQATAQIRAPRVGKAHGVKPSFDPLKDPALILREQPGFHHCPVSETIIKMKILVVISRIFHPDRDGVREKSLPSLIKQFPVFRHVFGSRFFKHFHQPPELDLSQFAAHPDIHGARLGHAVGRRHLSVPEAIVRHPVLDQQTTELFSAYFLRFHKKIQDTDFKTVNSSLPAASSERSETSTRVSTQFLRWIL